MGVSTGGSRGMCRLLVIALIATAVVLAVGAQAAFALPGTPPDGYVHGGASCSTCHTGGPTTASCTQCHTGFVPRSASYSCWSCHKPGQDMTTAKTNAGCTGTCHTLAGTSGTDYTTDRTHGATPHLGANAVGCRTCHTVSTSVTNPTGSPHHVTTDFTAPATCTDCHGNAAVPAAPAPHGELVAGATACTTCHKGYSPTHATTVVAPTLTLTAAQAGADVNLAGTLKNGTTALVGVTVYLQSKASGATTWTDLTQATTAAGGAYSFKVLGAAAGTTYRAISQGVAGPPVIKPAMRTAVVPVKEAITLKLNGKTTAIAILLGRTVKATGVIAPTLKVPQVVKLTVQKWRPATRKWVAVTTLSTLKVTGAYSKTYKPASRGTFRMRAVLTKTALHTAATSAWRTFKVK